MSDQKTHLKKAIVVRHRRKKKLCIRCGKDISAECKLSNCIEDYSRTDTRSELNITETDFEKRKGTIISYRKRKKLCLLCGCELHEGTCREDYIKSDNRCIEDKEFRPAIIEAPKTEKKLILDDLLKSINKPSILLSPTDKVIFQRPTIMIYLSKSSTENMIEYSFINQFSKKFHDHIIIILGDVEKYFPYSDFLKIKKLTNIMIIQYLTKQDIINHVHSIEKFFSYNNEYTEYCKRNSINYYEFPENKNVTNIVQLSAYQL